MRRFENCSPVIPVGSRFYEPPPMNPLVPPTAKSRALEQNHRLLFENPPMITPIATQVNMLNNSPYVMAGKTMNQVKYDTFEVAFTERVGNELYEKMEAGEISEDEFFYLVARERQRLRLERGETPTESEEFMSMAETEESERESEESEEEEPEPVKLLPKPRGGRRTGAGRMSREEKAKQVEMRMEGGFEKATKKEVQAVMTLEELASGS